MTHHALRMGVTVTVQASELDVDHSLKLREGVWYILLMKTELINTEADIEYLPSVSI